MFLKVENLSVNYGKIKALENVNIEVNKGEIIAIIGRNGAGKSTLLKTIIGLVKPIKGKIFFEDKEITQVEIYERAKLGIGYVPEGRRLFPYLTVLENLQIGAYNIKHKKNFERNLSFIYKLFPVLSQRKNQLARTLSGGEGEMLAISRGIISNVKLLLMDEPSLGLAPKIIEELFKTIKKLKEKEITILLVEQNAKKALSISDRCYVLETGRITFYSDSKHAINNPMIKKAYLG